MALAPTSVSNSSFGTSSSSAGSLPGGKQSSVKLDASAEHYKLTTLIGEGFIFISSVYLAKHVASDRTVAIKCIELDTHKDDADSEDNDGRRLSLAVSELHMTSINHHPNILRHLTAFVHLSQIWVVMDYLDKGSVRDILDSQYYDGLPEASIVCIIKQLMQALQYLHSKNIVHRSIKASHLLLSSNGHLHLTGLKYSALMERDGLPVTFISDFEGTYMEANLYWLSPQILAQHVSGYSTLSDIYSVGIVACEMANGLVPFCEMEPTKMFKEKLDGTVPKLIDKSTCPRIVPNGGEQMAVPGSDSSDMDKRHTMLQERVFSKGFHGFVAQCLSLSEHERPTASEALSGSFLKSHAKQNREALVRTLNGVHLHKNPEISVTDTGILPDAGHHSVTFSAGPSNDMSAGGSSGKDCDTLTDYCDWTFE